MIRNIKKPEALYVISTTVVIIAATFYLLAYIIITGFYRNILFMNKPELAGLAQYVGLFGDKIFVGSIANTVMWTFGSVVLQFGVGFPVVLLLNHAELRGRAVLRILLMIPWVLPSVIGSIVWKWMYNADYGIINFVLQTLGLVDKNKTWLSSTPTVVPAIIAVNVQKMFPLVFLMIEASLQGASKELKEAVVIDDANRLNIFKAVTWSAIAPACYSVTLLLTIWTLDTFTFVYTLTKGGLTHSTEVMAMYAYKEAFSSYDFGKANATSAILFVLSMTISFIYLRVTNKKENA